MEINRTALKKQARDALHGIYWFLFLACILAGLVGAGGGVSFGNVGSLTSGLSNVVSSDTETNEDNVVAEFNERGFSSGSDWSDFSADSAEEIIDEIEENGFMSVFVIGVLVLCFFIMIFSLAFKIFISGPAEICFAKTKLEAVYNRSTKAENFVFAFTNGYMKNVKAMFVKNLYLWCWSLFQLPAVALMLYALVCGIADNETDAALFAMVALLAEIVLCLPYYVKKYQYMLTPYIVAENPAIGARAAIRLSGEMMRGFKWQTFVLGLSFIGWYLLGSLAFGVGTLFVSPYYHTTETILYSELKAYHNDGASSGQAAIDTEIVQ